MNYAEALGLARYLISTGTPLDEAINNPAITSDFRSQILNDLRDEEVITLQPANVILDEESYTDW